MIRKVFREFYLLPRGEQRALVLLSFLVTVSLGIRVGVQMIPAREPSGMEQFREEAQLILAALEEADSLKRGSGSSHAGFSLPPFPVYSTPKKQMRMEKSPLNLNEADSVSLLPLPGIGPVFAGRIIKYRNILGGYAQAEQLLEVYGMDSSRYFPLIPLIRTDTNMVRKLKLNKATFRDLLRHPYLEYEDVKALVNYRDVVGHVSTLKELRYHRVLPDSILIRIRPYLDLADP